MGLTELKVDFNQSELKLLRWKGPQKSSSAFVTSETAEV